MTIETTDRSHSLEQYNFYHTLDLQRIGPIPAEKEKQVSSSVPNLAAQEVRYVDTISSAKNTSPEIAKTEIKTTDTEESSFWDWLTKKGEEALDALRSWWNGETKPTDATPTPIDKENPSTIPELDEPLEFKERAKLREGIREAFKTLDAFEIDDGELPASDDVFEKLMRLLFEAEARKSEDLKEDYTLQKQKHNGKRKQYLAVCEDYVSLEDKRKIAEWIDLGTSIGATAVQGILSLIGLFFEGQAMPDVFTNIVNAATSSIQGATQASNASFKYLTQRLRAQMIELKEKLRDQEDKLTKVIKDLGESFRRVAKYFQQVNKCRETWRRTVLSFFRSRS